MSRWEDSGNRLTSALTYLTKRKRALAITIPPTPVCIGAGEESRTPDLRITNALLYQLSYTGLSLPVYLTEARIRWP